MSRPPRRPGLGLGGRLEVRRAQALLHEAIAEQLLAQTEGAGREPEPAQAELDEGSSATAGG